MPMIMELSGPAVSRIQQQLYAPRSWWNTPAQLGGLLDPFKLHPLLVVIGIIGGAWLANRRGLFGGSLAGYKIHYQAGKDRVIEDQTISTLDQAMKQLRAYKARGRTAWVYDDAGNHVPVKGASRPPR